MSTSTIIMSVIALAAFIMYMMRRRARLSTED